MWNITHNNTLFRLRLATMRQAKDMSQAELARALGLDPSTIANYETGNRFPRPRDLVAICDYFGVSIDYVMGRTDIPHMAQFEIALQGLPVHLQELLMDNTALPAMEFVKQYMDAGIDIQELKDFLTNISNIRQKLRDLPPG